MAGYGDAIKRLRKERGFTNQLSLAQVVGIDRETLSRAENSGNVGILTIYQIAEALGVKASVSFGRASSRDFPAWWDKLSAEQRKKLERLARAWLGED